MAGALAPIPAFPIRPFKPVFATLEASTMGVLGTSKDGFDALLAPLLAAVPAHATQLAQIDAALAEAAFTPGVIVSTIYDPLGTRITALAKVGDGQLKSFMSDLINVTTTPPSGGSPQPVSGGGPTSSGGGGSTGQGGGGGYSGGMPGGSGSPTFDYPRFHNLQARLRYVAPPRPLLTKGKIGK